MDTASSRYAIFKAPCITRIDLPWTWDEYQEELFINEESGDTSFTLQDMITEEIEEIIKPSVNRINKYIDEWDEELYKKISNIR